MIRVAAVWEEPQQQELFRRLLQATSYPGRIECLTDLVEDQPPWLGVLATLVDQAASLADLTGWVDDQHWLKLQTSPAHPAEAGFVLADGRSPPPAGWQPHLGTLPRPELGATLVLAVESLGRGHCQLDLTGPGVPPHAPQQLTCAGLHAEWLAARQHWVADFPLGVDLILADAGSVACLPRSCQVRLVS